MINLELREFIEEIKTELMGYDEQGLAETWEKKFTEALKGGWLDKNLCRTVDGKQMVFLSDEDEIFDLADTYVLAVENEEEQLYWDGLR